MKSNNHQIRSEFLSKIDPSVSKLLESKVDWLNFRTYDIYKDGIPDSIIWSIEDIYNYCKTRNTDEVTILRLGNGPGKDLYIQKYLLDSLGVKPKYFLVDYDDSQHSESQKHNPDIPPQNYISHDLFTSLVEDNTLKKLVGSVDVIDCQEVLHEIASEGLGGSLDKLSALVAQFQTILKRDGIVLVCDVNIVESEPQKEINFSISPMFSRLIQTFNSRVKESDIKEIEPNHFVSSLRWFSVFIGKYRFLDIDNGRSARELSEIHRNLTVNEWKEMFEKSGLKLIHSRFPKTAQIIYDEIKENIRMSDRLKFPVFSIHILCQASY